MTLKVWTVAIALPLLLSAPPLAMAQEFMLPWEEKKKEEPVIDPERREDQEVIVGTIEIIRLPVPGKTVISSHPEVADVYLQSANRLFIIGRTLGITHITVADKNLTPIWNSELSVVVEKTH